MGLEAEHQGERSLGYLLEKKKIIDHHDFGQSWNIHYKNTGAGEGNKLWEEREK